jgi:CubicO group peptidase (beta-lactamase class C family)
LEIAFTRRTFLESIAAGTAGSGLVARGSNSRLAVHAPLALQSVRAFIVDKVGKGIVPSVVVKVTKHGRPLWAEAFGLADLETGRLATLESIYKIASVSKPFTVSALMTLVDTGVVTFDDPANQYLSGPKLRAFRGSPEQMTLRRLANHTSGLPIHEILFYDRAARLSPAQTISRYGFAAWVPGTKFVYSNLGTATLGFLSSDVSRKTWPRFMHDALLDPLGLASTFPEIVPGEEAAIAGQHAENLTPGYDYDISGRFVRTGAHLTSHPGASAMWSNVGDLTRFAEMHLNGGVHQGRQILSQASVATMQDFRVQSDEPGVVYGNGWISQAKLVRRNFEHSGGGPGMGVDLAAYPNDGITSVVLTNYFGAMAVETNRRIAEALFGPAAPLSAQPTGQPNATPDGLIGKWRGSLKHYAGDIPLAITVTSAKSAAIRFGRMPEATLSDVAARGLTFKGSITGVLMRGPGYDGDSIIDFELRREGDELIGIADTYSKGYFEVAFRVELQKAV